MFKTAIFDLDGLLIDSETVGFEIYTSILKSFKETITLEEYTGVYCGHTQIEAMGLLIEKHALPVSVEEGMKLFKGFEAQHLKEGIPLKAGARELLSHLSKKGVKMYIASSSTKMRAESILKANGVFDFFHGGVYGDEVENCKPAPDIFLKALKKSKNAPTECVIFEDSEAGIIASHKAGIPVICIPDLKVPSESILKLTKSVYPSLKDAICEF